MNADLTWVHPRNLRLNVLVEDLFREFEGGVAAGVNVGPREFHQCIRLDAGAFKSHTGSGAVIKFADVQNAAIRQRMTISNRKHTTTRLGADHARTLFSLQRRTKISAAL